MEPSEVEKRIHENDPVVEEEHVQDSIEWNTGASMAPVPGIDETEHLRWLNQLRGIKV
jgi:hypothetical protein